MTQGETEKVTIMDYSGGSPEKKAYELVTEEPLSIRIEGNPYSVVMRTPGDEIPHTAGFCLAEGLVDHPNDIATIGFCDDSDTNVATVTLTGERKKKVADLLDRKGFISQTSCGICGKEVIKDIEQILSPCENKVKITAQNAIDCADLLPSHQRLFKKTRSTHAAMIFDSHLGLLSSAEDVGRHNALDKAIGKIFMERNLSNAALGVMSSRLSYELVQKGARANLEVLIGISRPTALAVMLARSVNMTIGCVKGGSLMIFCGEERVTPPLP